MSAKNDFLSKVHETYASKRPKSKQLHQEACRSLPGGDSRYAVFYHPFPTYMKYGEGSRIYDVDGHVYTDFVNNHTSLIHGHAHPGIVAAVTEQAKKGSVYGAPCEGQIHLSQEICKRLPSADKVRFSNTGTEATMGALGLTRHIRRKYKFMKFEGCYHGTQDWAKISVYPPLEQAGSIEKPNAVPRDASVPPNVVKDCIVAPFNETAITERLINEHHDELSAIILEPVQCNIGVITPDPDFLKTLRDLATKYEIPLIFDEIITFRLSMGGAQEVFDVMPDITTLGKIIGGGYPVGAIAGREEFLERFSPFNEEFIPHSGTFNANPVTMAAGFASLSALTADKIERINALGDRLRNNFRKVFTDLGLKAQATGIGSLVQIHFTEKTVRNYRGAATDRPDLKSLLHLLMLDNGVKMTRCLFNVSTAMVEDDVDTAGEVLKRCLTEMMPYIEKNAPELLVS